MGSRAFGIAGMLSALRLFARCVKTTKHDFKAEAELAVS